MSRYKSSRSAHSDFNKAEMESSEIEKAKLQRQLRIMERERQAYSIQAREQIRKQQQKTMLLLKEQKELQYKLGACTRYYHQQQDGEDLRCLQIQLQYRDIIDKELEQEKQRQNEIEKEISKLQANMVEVKKREVSNTQKSEAWCKKAIATAEFKLERASAHFNKQLAELKRQRMELEALYVERACFQQLQHRMEKELHEVHKKIREMVDLCTAAHKTRMKAKSKMTMMREKAVKDLAQYNAEVKQLMHFIAPPRSIEFMTTKCKRRSALDDSQEMARRQLSEQKKQKREDDRFRSLEALEQSFERIRAMTGEEELDMLIVTFNKVEEQNAGLFEYVLVQRNEAEALRNQISHSQEKIEELRAQGLQQEQDLVSSLSNIETQLQETKYQTEDYDNQSGTIDQTLDQIVAGVTAMFSKMECDSSEIDNMLGSASGINQHNVMLYMGLVDHEIYELLTIQAFLDFKASEKDYKSGDLSEFPYGHTPDIPEENRVMQPAANSVEEYDAEDLPVVDEEERPLSLGELRELIRDKKGAERELSSRQTVDSNRISPQSSTMSVFVS